MCSRDRSHTHKISFRSFVFVCRSKNESQARLRSVCEYFSLFEEEKFNTDETSYGRKTSNGFGVFLTPFSCYCCCCDKIWCIVCCRSPLILLLNIIIFLDFVVVVVFSHVPQTQDVVICIPRWMYLCSRLYLSVYLCICADSLSIWASTATTKNNESKQKAKKKNLRAIQIHGTAQTLKHTQKTWRAQTLRIFLYFIPHTWRRYTFDLACV